MGAEDTIENRVDIVENTDESEGSNNKLEEDKNVPAISSNETSLPYEVKTEDNKTSEDPLELMQALYVDFPYEDEIGDLKALGFEEEDIRVALLVSKGDKNEAASKLLRVKLHRTNRDQQQ